MVAVSERRTPIRLGQKGVHLGLFEIPDLGFGSLFERRRPYFGAPSQMRR